jgi:predicted 2-oxoglutarate/Fe(II)-dependent dioxygenase YbiX
MAEESRGHLLPGDRLPDVRLHPDSGYGCTLHGHFGGTPLWLIKPSSVAVAATLPPVPTGITALCIGSSVPTFLPQGWCSYSAVTSWLELFDFDLIFQTDANLRLHTVAGLEDFCPPLPPPIESVLQAAVMQGAAPILQIPGVFDQALCSSIIRHLEVDCKGGHPSLVMVREGGDQTFQLDPSIKQRRESLPNDPQLEQHMHEQLMRRALPEISRVFNFAVGRRDSLKLLAYPENAGYFRAHRDNDTADVAHRRFALSINLNAGEYEGGEFRFPEFGRHRYAPTTGGAIVFSCSLLHEILPVERGTRYAMTTFLY